MLLPDRMVENAARVMLRDEIMQAPGWLPLDGTIDGDIGRLRRKLEAIADEPLLIKSVRGLGYVSVTYCPRRTTIKKGLAPVNRRPPPGGRN
jgi:DNA-binding response OmpR family regulator